MTEIQVAPQRYMQQNSNARFQLAQQIQKVGLRREMLGLLITIRYGSFIRDGSFHMGGSNLMGSEFKMDQ